MKCPSEQAPRLNRLLGRCVDLTPRGPFPSPTLDIDPTLLLCSAHSFYYLALHSNVQAGSILRGGFFQVTLQHVWCQLILDTCLFELDTS
jgi:hypothetical protein